MEKMKNDLISRSALIDHLRGNVFVDVTPALEQAIKDEPTAYDVDKVVEKLEGELELVVTQFPVRGKYIKKSRAIEIVKAGGINE